MANLYQGSNFVKRWNCPNSPPTEKVESFQICSELGTNTDSNPDQIVVKIHHILTGEEFENYSVNYFDYMWKIKYIVGSQFCEIYLYLYLCNTSKGYQINYRKVDGDYEPYYLFVCKLIEIFAVEKKIPPPPPISKSIPYTENITYPTIDECNNIFKLFNQPYLESKREALQIFIDMHPHPNPTIIDSLVQIIENEPNIVLEYIMDYLLVFLKIYQIKILQLLLYSPYYFLFLYNFFTLSLASLTFQPTFK